MVHKASGFFRLLTNPYLRMTSDDRILFYGWKKGTFRKKFRFVGRDFDLKNHPLIQGTDIYKLMAPICVNHYRQQVSNGCQPVNPFSTMGYPNWQLLPKGQPPQTYKKQRSTNTHFLNKKQSWSIMNIIVVTHFKKNTWLVKK